MQLRVLQGWGGGQSGRTAWSGTDILGLEDGEDWGIGVEEL